MDSEREKYSYKKYCKERSQDDLETLLTIPQKLVPKRIGYKSLRGAIRMLKAQNNKLKKLGASADFIIRLPIKD